MVTVKNSINVFNKFTERMFGLLAHYEVLNCLFLWRVGRPHAIMAIQFQTLTLQHMAVEVRRKDDEAKKDQAGTMKHLYKIEKYVL